MKKRSNKPNCTAKTVTECMVKLTKYVEDLDGAIGGFDSWSVLETGETVLVKVTWPAPKKEPGLRVVKPVEKKVVAKPKPAVKKDKT